MNKRNSEDANLQSSSSSKRSRSNKIDKKTLIELKIKKLEQFQKREDELQQQLLTEKEEEKEELLKHIEHEKQNEDNKIDNTDRVDNSIVDNSIVNNIKVNKNKKVKVNKKKDYKNKPLPKMRKIALQKKKMVL